MKTVAPITEQFQHLVRDLRESFWGDLYGQARGTLEKFLSRESVRLRDEGGGLRAGPAEGGAARPAQRVLLSGFCQPLRDVALAGGADAGGKFSARGPSAFSAASRGGDAADPGSVFARPLDAPGGPSGRDPDRRGGERPDGVEADAQPRSPGASLSPGTVEGRVGVSVPGWREPAGAAVGRSETRANAGRLRGARRRQSAAAGLPAQSGRESGGLGKSARGSLPARAGGGKPVAHRHRRRRGAGGDPDPLPARAASTLLGA